MNFYQNNNDKEINAFFAVVSTVVMIMCLMGIYIFELRETIKNKDTQIMELNKTITAFSNYDEVCNVKIENN